MSSAGPHAWVSPTMKFLVLLMLVAAAVTDSQPPKFPNGIIEVPNHNFDSWFRRRPNPLQGFEFDSTNRAPFSLGRHHDLDLDSGALEVGRAAELFLDRRNANIDKNANTFRYVNMAIQPMKMTLSNIGVVTAPASKDPVLMKTIDPKPLVDKADTGIPATESNGSPN